MFRLAFYNAEAYGNAVRNLLERAVQSGTSLPSGEGEGALPLRPRPPHRSLLSLLSNLGKRGLERG